MTVVRETKMSSKQINVLLGVGLWLITMILYWPVTGYEFIDFDDPLFVINNVHVNEGFTVDGIIWAFTKGEIDYWRPLTWLSHMADVEFFGMEPGPHHATSVVLHAFNAVLLLVFFLIALENRLAAFLIAALFAWHPLHVESVAWIAERKDVLSGFFWHACFVFYARYARGGPRKFYWLAFGMFGLGLMSKPMIVTLPCQLLLLDLWPFRRVQQGLADWKRLLIEKVPFLLLAITSSGFAYYAQRSVGEMAAGSVPELTMRIGNAFIAYGDYLKHTFLPIGLGVFYPYPESLPTTTLIFSIIVVLGATGFGIAACRSKPEILIGWLFFLGTIFPVVGLLKVGGQASADRYTYIATTGLFWIIAMVLFPGNGTRGSPRLPMLGIALALLLMLGLCRQQIAHWQNSISLFSHTVRVTKNNLVMMNNLALANLQQGNVEVARLLYEEIVAQRAQHFAHYYLGTIYDYRGDAAAAEFHYRTALFVDASFTPPAFKLGELLFTRRQFGEAENLFRRVLKAEPGNEAAADYMRRIALLTSRAQ